MQPDPLSPSSSPTTLSARLGVRRVNNMPLYIVGAVFTLFLITVLSVGFDRAKDAMADSVPALSSEGNASNQASRITGNRTGGFVPADGANLPVLDPSTPVPIVAVEDVEAPPVPPRLKDATIDPDRERIQREKMQLFETAVRSKTSVPFTEPQAAARPKGVVAKRPVEEVMAQQTDANAAFKARLAELQGKSPTETPPAVSADQQTTTDRWKLGNTVEAPTSPYIIRAGFVIPATLISGINSELPGQIIGQVSQHVYDSATGKHVLLPQGSRLVGSYTADVNYGQSRMMVAWQRIIFPDGKTLDIGSMPGSDSAGYAGLSDQVNAHYLRIFGSALLMSGITAGATLSQNNSNSIYAQPTTGTALSEALGQQLGTVTSQMIGKNLAVSPTLEIRPGFRFNVMVVKDLVLPGPYQSFDY